MSGGKFDRLWMRHVIGLCGRGCWHCAAEQSEAKGRRITELLLKQSKRRASRGKGE